MFTVADMLCIQGYVLGIGATWPRLGGSRTSGREDRRAMSQSDARESRPSPKSVSDQSHHVSAAAAASV